MPITLKRNINSVKEFVQFPFSEKLKTSIQKYGGLDTIQEAVIQGDALAQYLLSFMYYTGYQVNHNEKKAFYLLRIAAERGSWEAREILMSMLNSFDRDTRFCGIYHMTLLTRTPHFIRQFNLWAKHYPKILITLLQENPHDSYEIVEQLLTPDIRNNVYDLLQDFVMRLFLKIDFIFSAPFSTLIIEYLFEKEIISYMEDKFIPLPKEKIHINMLPELINVGVAGIEAFTIRRLHQAAKDGDIEAQFRLGNYFRDVPIKKRDLKESFDWYYQSASNGHNRAQTQLGRCYEEKRGVAYDLKKAIYWYRLAAEQKEEFAHKRLTTLFDGNVTLISPALIFHAALSIQRPDMLEALWKFVDTHPIEFIILLYESPEGTYDKIKSMGNDEFKKRLDRLLLEFLARILTILEMKLENYSLILVLKFLFSPSLIQKVLQIVKPNFINQNVKQDFVALSRQYLMDKDISPLNYMMCLRLMHNEASRGDAKAQSFLGSYYAAHPFMPDYERGFYWFRRGATQGYASAQYDLSICYAEGIGITKNKEKTFYWCQRAAHQGLPCAQEKLGSFYENGYIAFSDFKEAVYWYRKAAEQKFIPAIQRLTNMYHRSLPEHKPFVVYHVAITVQKKEMIDDLNKLAQENPKQFIEILQESEEDSFEKIQPLLKPKNANLIDRILKNPSYQQSSYRLYSIFNRMWEMLPTIRGPSVPRGYSGGCG